MIRSHMQENTQTKATIFNIQKFSLNDGPGIRTVVFFKGCPLRCKWCANPESQYARPQVLWNAKDCVHCYHCVSVCPNEALTVKEDKIVQDISKCAHCGTCVKECPKHALTMEGESKTIEDVMQVVRQDLPFYEESGGGVTLSGGEVLSQASFATTLLKQCHQEGIHTAIETTGFGSHDTFAKLIEEVDYVLFDFKHSNPFKHQEGTGVKNDLIIENLKYALSIGKTVLPRIPVIPGFNDSLEDALHLSTSLKELGINQCQLLPFHQYGENKYTLLNKDYAYHNIANLHPEDLKEYQEVFLNNQVEAFF